MRRILKITLLALLSPLFASAMQQLEPAALSSCPSEAFSSAQPERQLRGILPLECYLEILINAKTAEEAGQCARTFCRLNKTLYNMINDIGEDGTPTTNDLIREIARRNNIDQVNMVKVALALRTKGAQKWLLENLTWKRYNLLFQIYDPSQTAARSLFPDDENQEHDDAIRFLIRSLPHLAEVGEFPGLTGFPEVSQLKNLINAGVNVNLKNQLGQTALMCHIYNPETIRCLLGAGADVSLQDNDGYDALIYVQGAIRTRRKPEWHVQGTLEKLEKSHQLLREAQKKQNPSNWYCIVQ